MNKKRKRWFKSEDLNWLFSASHDARMLANLLLASGDARIVREKSEDFHERLCFFEDSSGASGDFSGFKLFKTKLRNEKEISSTVRLILLCS